MGSIGSPGLNKTQGQQGERGDPGMKGARGDPGKQGPKGNDSRKFADDCDCFSTLIPYLCPKLRSCRGILLLVRSSICPSVRSSR